MKKIVTLLVVIICNQLFAQVNLTDTSGWTVGTGYSSGFNIYGPISENERVMGTDPFGDSSVLWMSKPSGDGSTDGGIYGDYLTIDPNETYRFSVWIKKTGSNSGSSYFGLYCKDASNNETTMRFDGTINTNPYFWSGDLPQLDKWYLLVGYIHPNSYSGQTLGAAYDPDTGSMVSGMVMTDYKFALGATKMMLRSILFNTSNATDRQYYWNPTLYEVNGQEPTVQDLLGLGGGSDTQAPTAPTLASTGHTDSTTDLSWSGATDDTAVTGYRIYKDGVLEATLGNVSTYQVTGLTPGTSYNFTATALDAAGNESPASNAVSVTTNSSGGGGTVWNTSGNDINYTTGNVGIGTTAQANYRLAVDGTVHTREVKVDLVGWADYVFTEGYELPTLEEVEEHINEKGHLINIPSAAEVEANGIELGEMNRLLLEKIEELTLYTIEQQKTIHYLIDEINLLKK